MKKGKLLLTSLLASVLVLGGSLVSCTTSGDEEEPDTTEPGPTEPEETAATLVSIAVTSLPTKTEYAVDEDFDSTGLVVTAIYDDSTTAVVTGYTLSDVDTSTAGTKEVTVTYTEGDVTVTTQFEISVAVYYSLTYQTSDSDPDNLITAFSYSALGINIRDDDKTVITRAQEGETVYFQHYNGLGLSFDNIYLNGSELERNEEYENYYIYTFTMPADDVVITITRSTTYSLNIVTYGEDVGEEVQIAFCRGRYNYNNIYTSADEGTKVYLNIGKELDTETYEVTSCTAVDGNGDSVTLSDLTGTFTSNYVAFSWEFTMPASSVTAYITFGLVSAE